MVPFALAGLAPFASVFFSWAIPQVPANALNGSASTSSYVTTASAPAISPIPTAQQTVKLPGLIGTWTFYGSNAGGLSNIPFVPYLPVAPTGNPGSSTTPPSTPPISSPSPPPTPPTVPSLPETTGLGSGVGQSASISQDIQQLVAMTNQDRAQNGLPALTVNLQLATLAQERATAMAQDHYYSHDSPVYGWPYQMEQKAGIHAQWMGAENIAEASSAAKANAEFMASPPHRANILDPRETQIGIGVAALPNMPGYIVISELFLGPSL